MNSSEKENIKNSPDIYDDEDATSRKLDEKLMELQSLFEMSQTLNSSLNLISILDNMLLTTMGKMMITRGIVLLYKNETFLRVETLKGLPPDLVGKIIEEKIEITEPTFLGEILFYFFQSAAAIKILAILDSVKNFLANNILNQSWNI